MHTYGDKLTTEKFAEIDQRFNVIYKKLEMLIDGHTRQMNRRAWMTSAELAEYLSLSVKTVRSMAAEGRLPHRKINGEYRFNRRQIDTWLLTGSDKPGKRQRDIFKEFID